MKKNQVKLGAILSYVIIVLNMIIGIAYTPILTSKLGQSEYGLYSLVSSIVSYLTILDMGFGSAIIIYTARYIKSGDKEKEKKLHGMFFVIYTVIGIIAGIIGLILYFNVNNLFCSTMNIEELKTAKTLMAILVFNLVMTFPLSIFSSIISGYEKFAFSKTINIIRILLNPIIMLILLNYGYKSIALVIVITALNISSLLINMIYCILKLKIKMNFKGFDKKLLKEIFGFSFFIALNTIIDKANWSIDQFVLGAAAGTIAVSIYSVASQLNSMYLNFSTAISNVLLPRAAQMQEENASDEQFSDLFIKTGRIQYLILALIISGFVLFGKEFIQLLWVGPEYWESYVVACVLMIPVTIPLIQNTGINILQVKNLYKYRTMILLVIAIFNVAISIPLANHYGAVGSALGTAISLMLGHVLILNIFYAKKVHLDIKRFWKNISYITVYVLIVFFSGLILKNVMLIENKLTLIFEIMIYTLLYCFVIYKFAMNSYEKNIIKKPLQKFLNVKRGN